MISALPVSGAWVPNTTEAHSERPRISFISASFTCPYPWPPSSGPRWQAHSPRSRTWCLSGSTMARNAGSSGWKARSPHSRSSGWTSSRTKVSIQSSCSWNAGSVEKSQAMLSVLRFGVAGKSEDAFADHVALDLTGPPGDGEAACGQRTLRPACGPAVHDGAVWAHHGQTELLDPLLVLGAQQLAQARPRAGVRAGQRAQRRPMGHERQGLRLGQQGTQPHCGGFGYTAVLARRLADQRLDPDAEGGTRGDRDAFVGQRHPGDAPPVVDVSDHAVVGHEHVVEEDLVEQRRPGQLA